jgi:hypothetical protein
VDRDANYDDEPSKKELIAQQKERFASLRESEYDD